MSIRNQIEAIVNQLVTKPKFLYGTAKELNLLADDTDFPVVMMFSIQPISKSSTLSNAVNNSFSVYLEFLFKTEFDQYSSDNETYIQQASDMADEFWVKMQYYRETPLESRFFKIKKDEKAKSVPVYNRFDVNSTGVNLTMNVKTMNNANIDPMSRPV